MGKQRMNNYQINEAFDKLINEFNTFKSSFETLKNEVNSKVENTITDFQLERSEINSFKETQKNDVAEFKKTKENEINEIIVNIEEKKAQIDTYNSKLFNEENGIEHKINLLKEEINQYYKELLGGDDENYSIRERISDTYKELVKYQKEVFGYKLKDEEGNVTAHTGIKDDIVLLLKRYDGEIEKFKDDSHKLIEAKKEEMDDLLGKMNLNYDAVEKEALSKKYFELSEDKNTSVIYSIILVSLYSIALTIALIYLFTSSDLKELFNKENLISGAIIRIAITTPLMYLVVITSNKLSREIAVRDQYNYKGLIMTTYRNVSAHLNNSLFQNVEEKQVELLDKVFNKILENEADKQEKSNKYNLKYLSNFVGKLAKDLGTDKNTLISILPDVIEKLKPSNQNNERKSPLVKDEES